MKLAPRFYGPYQIIEKVGVVAYKLALPSGSQIHNVFHVSLLQKHAGTNAPASTQLPPVADDSTILPQPEAVLNCCVIRKGKYRPRSEILVKWKGAPMEDANWEKEWCFSKSFPGLVLSLRTRILGGGGGGNDTCHYSWSHASHYSCYYSFSHASHYWCHHSWSHACTCYI